MRVLLATMQYGRGYGQGTERYVSMLADGLLRAGGRVVVVGGDPEGRGPRLRLGDAVEQSAIRGDLTGQTRSLAVAARIEAAPTDHRSLPVAARTEAAPADDRSLPVAAQMEAAPADDRSLPVAARTEAAPADDRSLPVAARTVAAPTDDRSLPVAARMEAAPAGDGPLGESAFVRVLHAPTPSRLSIVGTEPAAWQELLNREQPELVHLVNPGHIGVGLAMAAHAQGRPVVITVVDYWWLCPKQTLLHHSGQICDGEVPWHECLRCLGADDRRPWMRGVARVPVVRSIALPTLYFGRALAGGMALEEVGRWTHRRQVVSDVLNTASAVIFLSQGARRRIAPLISHPRLHTIQVGLEARWFGGIANREGRIAKGGRAGTGGEDGDAAARGARDPAALTIGFVGALKPHKGPHVLLAALRRLGWLQTRVRLIGTGDDARYVAQLRKLAQGMNVEFVGRVPTEQMPETYATLDLLVVPSLWPENLPQTVLEATAIGVPVLASDVDGISEVVTEPRARFAVGDPAALAACLAAWQREPTLGAATPPRTAEEMVADTLAVYRAVV